MATEKRNRASGYDRILYESERKRSYEGRTASSAAISAARRGHSATGREQLRRATEEVSTQMSQKWDETKHKASRAFDRTEDFLRENPVPTILGALGFGIAIGLAIRYAAPTNANGKSRWSRPGANFNWSVSFAAVSLAAVQIGPEKSEDVMRNGVKRLKKMDVERYAKPIRKRWKAWTR
jgi:ElaB/YqjD/DUF883 family membrane-anchored ribosome-binding protein